MPKHEHVFTVHVGIRVFGGRSIAWVPKSLVVHRWYWDNEEPTHPEMWRCTRCGEQGYETPA